VYVYTVQYIDRVREEQKQQQQQRQVPANKMAAAHSGKTQCCWRCLCWLLHAVSHLFSPLHSWDWVFRFAFNAASF